MNGDAAKPKKVGSNNWDTVLEKKRVLEWFWSLVIIGPLVWGFNLQLLSFQKGREGLEFTKGQVFSCLYF